MQPVLVDDHAVHQLGVGDPATHLLLHSDVVCVHRAVIIHHGLYSLNRQAGQLVSGRAGALAGHGGYGDLLEKFGILYRDIRGDGLQNLQGFVRCRSVAGSDNRGMDLLIQKALGLLEQLSGQDHCGGGAVSHLSILGLGDLHHHLGCGVLYVHLLKNSDAVVGYDHIAQGVDHHLVHALGPQGGPDRSGHGLGGHDVRSLCFPARRSLAAFL